MNEWSLLSSAQHYYYAYSLIPLRGDSAAVIDPLMTSCISLRMDSIASQNRSIIFINDNDDDTDTDDHDHDIDDDNNYDDYRNDDDDDTDVDDCEVYHDDDDNNNFNYHLITSLSHLVLPYLLTQ
jgi:hypothetical protein